MTPTLRLRLGPTDHGRALTYDEYCQGDFLEGHHYELIDGRLYVAPAANLPEDSLRIWLHTRLVNYAAQCPDVINHASTNARVFVPGRPGTTVPEPDVAAYRAFPHHVPFRQRRWEDVSPLLVAEILGGDEEKDLVRNVDLYARVPSIREYWVFDIRDATPGPLLRVYRRSGRRWRELELLIGQTYTTRLLPGFELVLAEDQI